MRSFKFSDVIHTDKNDPLIIAEIGINHNGKLEDALKLSELAIDSGAKFIKLQTHIANEEMSSEAKKIIPVHTEESIFQIIQDCELSIKEEKIVADYVQSRSCNFISTPFSIKAVNRVASLGVPFLKIGSGEFNNYPLITEACKTGLPLLLSTGMNDLKSIDKTVKLIKDFGNDFALMHCTNIYPTPNENVRLNAISEMRDRYKDTIIGLSDHTLTNHACFGAMAMGASIIERHFTDSKERIGPDICCSMTPNELKDLLIAAEIYKEQRGGTKNFLITAEDSTREFAFASIVSTCDLNAGDILTKNVISVKRPGTGDFKAADLEKLIGKKLIKNIKANTQLKKDQIQ